VGKASFYSGTGGLKACHDAFECFAIAGVGHAFTTAPVAFFLEGYDNDVGGRLAATRDGEVSGDGPALLGD
jgi:hypothetical protein